MHTRRIPYLDEQRSVGRALQAVAFDELRPTIRPGTPAFLSTILEKCWRSLDTRPTLTDIRADITSAAGNRYAFPAGAPVPTAKKQSRVSVARRLFSRSKSKSPSPSIEEALPGQADIDGWPRPPLGVRAPAYSPAGVCSSVLSYGVWCLRRREGYMIFGMGLGQ